ncbi:MAG: hydrogenase expression/formation protein HypE [Methylomicrobium sp.]|nr:hydrogenase expression/formation protein HypE [Methylomicrobium sp.]
MITEHSFSDTYITLAHGNGGRFMRELIEHLFAKYLDNNWLDTRADAAAMPFDESDGELMITTDGFTVDPLEFPGGNIGSLAIHGTVNDLAVAGATPRYLSLNAFIEEGLEIAVLDRLIRSMAEACRECGVDIVAGDTKVLRRGQGGGVYFAVTGVGKRPHSVNLGIDHIQAGDCILLSGTAGDHGCSVLLAREQFGLSGTLQSDAASVFPVTRALLDLPGLRFMRDPTRGGIATVAHEIASAVAGTVKLLESTIPINEQVKTVAEILGYDPYYLACEGRVMAVVSAGDAEEALKRMRSAGCSDAAIIGEVHAGRAQVILETTLGGERILEELEDDPLPRIC